MYGADPAGKPLELGVVMSACGSGFVLVQVDHFVGHGRHQEPGGTDEAGGNGDFAESIGPRLPVTAAKMAKPVLGAQDAKDNMVCIRQAPMPEGWAFSQIFIRQFQHLGGEAQSGHSFNSR